MIRKINYKITITSLLLALYAFIATPVSYWHHHENNVNKSQTEKHSQIVKKSTLPTFAYCKTCSHHYSVSNKDANIIYFSSESFFASYNIYFFINKITNPSYKQSNKGPPAIV